VAEILKVVQLEHLAQRMPHELSGGQQQRVGLARALVTRPKVMLMDEPLSNLDAQLRVDLRKELRFIQQELGITTIYVTHDQEEALEMSDHVCVMHKGIIQQAASPWQIYQQPANQFVASFVGSNNFLPVTVRDGQVQICHTIIERAPQSVVMAGANGAGIVAAIRPEHIQLSIDPHCATEEGYINIAATLNHQAFAGRELRVSALASDKTPIQLITQPLLDYLELPAHSPVRLLVKISDIGFYRNDEGGERV
jgi:iron(III) transport system ATP-binding protein